ncbi:MAG: glycosyltransferase [Dehalococcoidia bacterium]|nr:MAG: glycosyltransferase [Dehalococcoidia bacterium]
MKNLNDYREIVGDEIIDEILSRAQKFRGRKIVHINSTGEGGGVAEILKSLVPLMNHVGIETEWLVLDGSDDFFALTKEFHNALQGGAINLDEKRESLYCQTNQTFSAKCTIDADCVVVHDPQPLPLIAFYDKNQPWVWRCHVDLSHPNKMLWEFLKDFIVKYDIAIMSHEGYRKQDLPLEQRIIYPAIDPLSPKNTWLPENTVRDYCGKAGIPMDKPVITQVSRMDLWKDPEGLLDVFDHVRQKVDCRLIYCYSSSIDDPEGFEVLSRTYRKAGKFVEQGDVLFIEGTDQTLVNAIQCFSSVIMQKSVREGFCLCVTEGLWKGRPVVATNVGGIPIQLREAENGYLVEPHDTVGFADKVTELLQNPDLADHMGKQGREIVRQNFLITRFMLDCLDLYEDLLCQPN